MSDNANNPPPPSRKLQPLPNEQKAAQLIVRGAPLLDVIVTLINLNNVDIELMEQLSAARVLLNIPQRTVTS